MVLVIDFAVCAIVTIGSVVWCGISSVPSSMEEKFSVIPFQILVIKERDVNGIQ